MQPSPLSIDLNGNLYYPGHMTPEMVNAEHVAHALAHQFRYGGALERNVTEAQHAVLMSFAVAPQEFALHALTDSAPKAYVGCPTLPVRDVLRMHGVAWERVLTPASRACELFFGTGNPAAAGPVYKAKRAVRAAELRDLGPRVRPVEWHKAWGEAAEAPYGERIVPWAPDKARDWWLERYYELSGGTRGG